jgi:hypothetical protein
MDRSQDKPRAREVLRDWARAPGYSVRAAEFLELARCASAPNVRKRYAKIAQHYLTLADAEKRAQLKKADRKERFSEPKQFINPQGEAMCLQPQPTRSSIQQKSKLI